jgi:hypothetical protein
MADVRVRRIKEVTVEKEGATPKGERTEKDYTVYVDKLGDEGGAMVSRSRSIQQGMSLDYGEFKISIQDTATVSVRCEQTLKRIKLANKVTCQLRDQFLQEDFSDSGKLLRKLMKAAAAKSKRTES